VVALVDDLVERFVLLVTTLEAVDGTTDDRHHDEATTARRPSPSHVGRPVVAGAIGVR